MGCGSCGSSGSGKVAGCSSGGCSTGGCNRLNVYDWLNTIPLHDHAKPYPIIEVSFNKGSRKEFFRNNTNYILHKNDWITVEGVGGFDIGQVSVTGELVKLQMKKYGVQEGAVAKRVLHPSTEEELAICNTNKGREADFLIRSRAIARSIKLDMKLCEVEVQADGKKGTFFYTADSRVDFRELIKMFANDFKMKIEMRQIGARQESGKVGGIGSCGRELCCSTWLSEFKSVNTTAARYQNLSINQVKLSGQCGRLKCCLNYELDTYLDALSVFPDHAEHLETVKGVAHLQKRDIFKNLMWYSFSDNNKQYPLSITRVKEIQKLNKQGQKVDDLQPVELETQHEKNGVKPDMGFVSDVGQITLKNLEKGSKKKKTQQNQNQQRPNNNRDGQQPPQGGNRPNNNQGGENRNNRDGQQPQQGSNRPNNNQGGEIKNNRDGQQPQQGGNRSNNNQNGENRNKGQQQGGQKRQDNRNNQPRQDKPQNNQQNQEPRQEQNQGENPEQKPQQNRNEQRPNRPEHQHRNNQNRPQGPRPERQPQNQQGGEGQPQNPNPEQKTGEGGEQRKQHPQRHNHKPHNRGGQGQQGKGEEPKPTES